MREEKIMLGIDFGTASQLLIEIMLEEGVETDVLREIADKNKHRPEVLAMIAEHPDVPDEMKVQLSQSLRSQAKERTPKDKSHKTQEQREQTILQSVQKLTVSEKLLLALRGGREVRARARLIGGICKAFSPVCRIGVVANRVFTIQCGRFLLRQIACDVQSIDAHNPCEHLM